MNDAAKLREDLWTNFANLKAGAGFSCAAQQVACGEVELVHAGNEYNQQGWRHANPYVQIAEDSADGAGKAAAGCNPIPLPSKAKACVPGPAPECRPVVVQKLSLSADALFKFDKSALNDLLPAGRIRIDQMLGKLNGVYSQISRIAVTGHTDRLGTEQYNQALSEHRAATIRQYLVSKGIDAEIVAAGKGESEQIAPCSDVFKRSALIECLQPNRRVDIEVQGTVR